MVAQHPAGRGSRSAACLLLGLWAAAAAAEALPRTAAEAAFAEALRQVKEARDTLAQHPDPPGVVANGPALAAAEQQLALATAAEAEARTALGEALAAEYRDRYLRLSTRPGARWAEGQYVLCVDLSNSGPLAVRAIGLGLRLRDFDLRAEAPLGGLLSAESETADVVIPANTDGVGPAAGRLAPWRSWRQPEATCLRLDPAPPPGSAAARLLQRLGGFSRTPGDWRLTLGDATLARPAATAEEPHEAVFGEEIARIERRALGARPAAPGAAAPERPADPRVVRVQEALTARGFGTGQPDGVAGPRTIAAIRSFQEARGEPATGSLTEEQLRALLGEAL